MSIQKSNANRSVLPSFNDFVQGIKDPIAAGAAIILPYTFFRDKLYLQLGEQIPPRKVIPLLKEGMAASPVICGIVGLQIILQKTFNFYLEEMCGLYINEANRTKYASDLASCGIVAAISTPGYIEFNRRAMKMPFSKKMLFNAKQAKFIAFRELCFMTSLTASGPIAHKMKEEFGDTNIIEYSSIFFIGAIGSLVGHPADTVTTRLLKGKPVDYKWNLKDMKRNVHNMHSLMQGSLIKAYGVGFFYIGLHLCKESMSKVW